MTDYHSVRLSRRSSLIAGEHLIQGNQKILGAVIKVSEFWRHAKLPENLVAVEVVPDFDDLAIHHAEPAVPANYNLLPSGRYSIPFAGVCPSGRPVDDHKVTFDVHPPDRHHQVRSSRAPSFALGHSLFQPGFAVAEMDTAVFCIDLVDELIASPAEQIVVHAAHHSLVLFCRRNLHLTGKAGPGLHGRGWFLLWVGR